MTHPDTIALLLQLRHHAAAITAAIAALEHLARARKRSKIVEIASRQPTAA